MAAVIEAARKTGAEAIHPGYGFLSEDPDFAEVCEDNGFAFIGPPPAVLAKLGDKFDAVSVSTPDHSHAIASLKAIELKKHVYTQKPLARAASENRMLADAARANPTVMTQMGTQRSARSFCPVLRYVVADVLGSERRDSSARLVQ